MNCLFLCLEESPTSDLREFSKFWDFQKIVQFLTFPMTKKIHTPWLSRHGSPVPWCHLWVVRCNDHEVLLPVRLLNIPGLIWVCQDRTSSMNVFTQLCWGINVHLVWTFSPNFAEDRSYCAPWRLLWVGHASCHHTDHTFSRGLPLAKPQIHSRTKYFTICIFHNHSTNFRLKKTTPWLGKSPFSPHPR